MRMHPVGWRYESARHSLAAHGIHTKGYFLPLRMMPHYQIAEIVREKGVQAGKEAEQWVKEHPEASAKDLAEVFGVEYVRKPKGETIERAYEELGRVSEPLLLGPRGEGLAGERVSFEQVVQRKVDVLGEENKKKELNRLLEEKARKDGRIIELSDEIAGFSETGRGAEGKLRYLKDRLAEAKNESTVLLLDIMQKQKLSPGDFVKWWQKEQIGGGVAEEFAKQIEPTPVLAVMPQTTL